MVHFFVNNVRPYPLIWSLVLAFLFLDATPYAAKIVTVEEICKNPNPAYALTFAYCSNLLNSIPGGAKGANVDSLAQYTLEVLQSNLTNTVNLLKSLIANSSTSPDLLDVYHICLNNLDDIGGRGQQGALAEIKAIKNGLKQHAYGLVISGLHDTLFYLRSCTSVDHGTPNRDFHDPSLLPQYTGDILKVIGILDAISGYLFS
ncbi:hypothetical protein HN51_041951 [Arachis hypogaea]|uniref:Pectinesterase inhibitor domain-containing protein n=1 Tax=Arachis hypogaea TaxID=3818 RepID=A0A444YUY8_ARAHY|nr:hypothetical protein Ahy_B06g085539 [Arachis hypogaea]